MASTTFVLNARELADDGLHLFQLDAETTNLHLSVATTHKLDIAIGQIAHDVARTIDTAVFRVGRKRIRQIGLRCLLRTVQIADDIQYRRKDGQNELMIIKNI